MSHFMYQCRDSKRNLDPDTIFLWEKRKEKDFDNFKEAMQHEIGDHTKLCNWKLCMRADLSNEATVCRMYGQYEEKMSYLYA